MAILAECPICHRKQANKNKKCSCGENLDKAKKSKRVNYWITYRVEGKQRRESIGKSLTDAQAAEGKRKAQKREGRVLDMLPESKITFEELSAWYLNLKSVKKLKSMVRVKGCLKNFNDVFGQHLVNKIKLEDLENYQIKREEIGRSPATIDMEIKYAQTVVTKAFDNDKIDVAPLKAFRNVKRMLKKGSNARKRKLTLHEYNSLVEHAAPHLRGILIMANNTGMRLGEIRQLRWPHIDRKAGFIRLKPEDTKEGREKNIPINHHVIAEIDNIIQHIDHDFVFTYRGKPIVHKNGCKGAFITACKKSDIPYGEKTKNGVVFHDIRTTVKTNMLTAGVNKIHRDVILGHTLQGMDVHYIALEDKELMEAMNIYTAWLDSELSVDQIEKC